MQPYLQFAKALYYECCYRRARKNWPIAREWVAGCVPILVNGPRDEAAAARAKVS